MPKFADVTASPYLATGNGTSDDRASIQTALNAVGGPGGAGGGVVYCPPCSVAYSIPSPGLTVYSNIELRLAKGAWLRKDYSVGGGLAGAFLRNADFSAKLSGFAITGEGKIGALDLSKAGDILGLWGDDIRLSDFTIDTYGGVGGGHSAGRAITLGGDRVRVSGVRITNPYNSSGVGGICIFAGNDLVVYACHVESGDDALQFVPLAPANSGPDQMLADMSISRGTFIGCTGFSLQGRFLIVDLEDPNGDPNVGYTMRSSITDCSFVACRGKGSTRRIAVTNASSVGEVVTSPFVIARLICRRARLLLGRVTCGSIVGIMVRFGGSVLMVCGC